MAPKYSLPKEKIKFLLLEGVHERAIERIERAGYSNLRVESSALAPDERSEEHTSELQSRGHLVCRLLLEKKKKLKYKAIQPLQMRAYTRNKSKRHRQYNELSRMMRSVSTAS